MSKRDLANLLEIVCKSAGLPPFVREHRFHEKRRWRFDLAWPDHKVAVEVHGGEWSGGRHVRGAGLTKDSEKMRAAQILRWTVLPFPGSMVKKEPGRCVEEIRAALAGTTVEY